MLCLRSLFAQWLKIVMLSSLWLGIPAGAFAEEQTEPVDPRLAELEDPYGIMKILPQVRPAEEAAVYEEIKDEQQEGLDWEKIEKLMAEGSQNYRSSSENRFMITSDSVHAASWVVSVANEVLRTGSRYLFHSASRGRQILVEMPYVQERPPAPFRTALLPNGDVRLVIPWNDQVNKRLVFQGLFQALLVSEVYAEFGPEAALQVKPWAELALTIALEVQLVPTLLDEYQRQAPSLPWIPLVQLFSMQQPIANPSAVAENGFWFLRWLERFPMRPELKNRLVLLLSCSPDPSQVLAKAFPREWQMEPGLEAWWAARFQDSINFQNSPYWEMEKSRELLRKLATIRFPYDDKIQAVMMRDWSGWVLYDPARAAIDDNMQELQAVLGFVHPVYYNAYLSLGLLMEFCLNEFKSEQDLPRWEELLKNAERDVRTAIRLEQDIQNLLQNP